MRIGQDDPLALLTLPSSSQDITHTQPLGLSPDLLFQCLGLCLSSTFLLFRAGFGGEDGLDLEGRSDKSQKSGERDILDQVVEEEFRGRRKGAVLSQDSLLEPPSTLVNSWQASSGSKKKGSYRVDATYHDEGDTSSKTDTI